MGRAKRIGRTAGACLVAAAFLAGAAGARHGEAQTVPSRWWKTDLHVHSITSGDAVQDIGVMSVAARKLGFNAIFLTDHSAGDNAPIGGVIANHVFMKDDVLQWKPATFGSPTASTDELAKSPVRSGSASLHLGVTAASTYGESFEWYKRGPDLHEGRDVLRFSVYPTRIDPGAGAYVSIAVGGDPMMQFENGKDFLDDPSTPGHGYPVQGYVNAQGQILSGHSVVFVWELGGPRADAATPTSRTVVTKLPYRLNHWNTYTIDVTKAFATLPAAIRPSADEALEAIRLVAGASSGGSADAYFDDVTLDSTQPEGTGEEFVRRNREIPRYDAPGFRIFPSLEAGLKDHAQRFDYAITTPAQWTLFKTGQASIPGTHAAGYPAQLNHPGLPGGVTTGQAISTNAEGADLIEAVPRGTNDVMLKVWDSILEKGYDVVGTWTSDAHRTEKLGQATYLYAPALTMDSLLRAAYEGRAYMALATFSGRIVLNLDPTSDAPVAARYPVYVPAAQKLALVHLAISGGIPAGAHVVWIRNGVQVADDALTADSADLLYQLPLGGPFTYVRAELLAPDGTLLGMTEPIFFRRASLPAGTTVQAAGVATPDGRGYTRLETLGIATPTFARGALDVGLPDRPGSTVSVQVATGGYAPAGATGAKVVSSTYDPVRRVAVFAVRAGSGARLHVSLRPSAASLPAAPTGLHAASSGATDVGLVWDAPAVASRAAIVVLRDREPIAAVPPGATSYVDATAKPQTTYEYALASLGFDGRQSSAGAALSVTTERLQTLTLVPSGDTYVDANRPTSAFGTKTFLRLGASPASVAYLRFDLHGVTGTVTNATLRIWANTGGAGFDVHTAPSGWPETMTYSSAPPFTATPAGSSGPVTRGAWTTVDVTSLLDGSSELDLALTATSSRLNLASREAGDKAPQLVVQTQS